MDKQPLDDRGLDLDRERQSQMRLVLGRQKSLSGLKTSANMMVLEKQEKIFSKRKSLISLDVRPPAQEQPLTKLKHGVNVIRAAIRFGKALKVIRKETPANERERLQLGTLMRASNRINTINGILAQPTPQRRTGLSIAMIARLGARRATTDKEGENGGGENTAVQKVMWASKFFRKTLHRFKNDGDAKHLFFKGVRKVLVLLKWKAQLQEEAKTVESELKTFLDMAQEFDDAEVAENIEEKSGLSFDVRMFKANRSIKLSEETKLILTTPSSARTDETIQKAQSELQMMKSFSEYPIHMQVKLVKVAWYQEINAKRIILKEGHFAENFYFILSGQANVKKMVHNKKTGTPTMTTLGRLKDGQCFGEIALIHHSRRTATVESASNCHLLLIGREDFMDIFLNSKDGKEPEHIAFCRNIPLLRNWPVSSLADANKFCMFNFFRRGCVVVSDSTEDDWIYIVKSGSCLILKRLDAVTPRKTWIRRIEPQTLKLPRIGTADIVAKTDSNYPSTLLPLRVPETIQRAMTDFFTTQNQNTANKGEPPYTAPTRTSRLPSLVSQLNDTEPCNAHAEGYLSPKMSISGSGRSTPTSARNTPVDKPPESRPHSGCSRPSSSKSSVAQSEHPVEATKTEPTEQQAKDDDQTKEPEDPVQFEELPEPTVGKAKQPCFIQLRKLVEGETFGFEYIVFEHEQVDDNQPSVAMVSNGAELVMINKAFFLRHSNETVQRHVRHAIQKYPDDEALQRNLETEVNWKLYKECLIADFYKNGTTLVS